MPIRHFLRSDIFTVAMVYFFIFVCFLLNEIANKNGKTIGQVILRWHYQHQSVPCFKSLKPKRLAENFDIWDFELTQEDMDAINSMDCDYKYHLESASCPGF